MKKSTALTLLTTLASVYSGIAAPESFDFKDPKGVNNINFHLDAPLESINGIATGISGTVQYDPESPAGLTGKIVVQANSLKVPNNTMEGHLQSPMWLDVAKYPEITFQIIKGELTPHGDVANGKVTGTLTIKGISEEYTVPINIHYLKDKLQDRVPNMKGDLMVVHTKLNIDRNTFGINKGKFEDKVGNTIELDIHIVGQAAH